MTVEVGIAVLAPAAALLLAHWLEGVPISFFLGAIMAAVIVLLIGAAERQAAQLASRAFDRLDASLGQARALSQRLLRVEDDERRRIAQTLHDTTAQDLGALKMHLARLGRSSTLSPTDRSILTLITELADKSIASIRTLSYLLHPPFLDDQGLAAALEWYGAGFTSRSGIDVTVDVPDGFDRLPQAIETTLFRVMQEALINVHHHAKSATATIRLRRTGSTVELTIEDHGAGMNLDVLANVTAGRGGGLGIAGMRERLDQIGGQLRISSNSNGTTVRATVPVDVPGSVDRAGRSSSSITIRA